jgi:hypothetical protein
MCEDFFWELLKGEEEKSKEYEKVRIWIDIIQGVKKLNLHQVFAFFEFSIMN